MLRPMSRLAAVLVGVGALAACGELWGITSLSVAPESVDATTPPPLPDTGGPPAGDAGRPDATPACMGAAPPAAPAQSTPSAVSGSFFVAMQTVTFEDPPDGGEPLGLNLDQDCTCEGPGDDGPASCVGATPNCDGVDGRDVALTRLVQLFDALFPGAFEARFDHLVATGRLSFLIGVVDYDEGPDDVQLGVTGYVASGIVAPDGGSGGAPRWDGTDVWSVDPASESGYKDAGPDSSGVYEPRYFASQAYVTNGVLVAELPEIALDLGVGTFQIENVILVARIGTSAAGHTLDGQLVGRCQLRNILSFVSGIEDPAMPGAYLCGDDATYLNDVKPAICHAADVMGDPLLDNTGAACDGLSVAMGFHAVEARVGPPVPLPRAVSTCDASDDCP